MASGPLIESHHLKTDEDRVVDLIKRVQEAEGKRKQTPYHEQEFQRLKQDLERFRATLPRVRRANERMGAQREKQMTVHRRPV